MSKKYKFADNHKIFLVNFAAAPDLYKKVLTILNRQFPGVNAVGRIRFICAQKPEPGMRGSFYGTRFK
jgi:hypothetical protein